MSPTPTDDYHLTIAELETELDEICPAWDCVRGRIQHGKPNPNTAGRPMTGLEYDRLARIKWLLKRRSMMAKEEVPGMSAKIQGQPPWPRWGVLVRQDTRDPRKCYAHPVPPHQDGRPARPPAPPRVAPYEEVEHLARPSLPVIAAKARMPLEKVEAVYEAYSGPPGEFTAELAKELAGVSP